MFSANQLNAQCNAGFTFKSKICAGTDLQFFANDTTPGRTYQWNFGDPFSGVLNEDTIQSPTHFYSDTGTYTITLIVSDTACSDTQTATLFVYKKPVAAFSSINNCAGLNTIFNNQSVSSPADSIVSYSWDLGNSNTSNARHPNFTYSSTGTVNIQLIIATQAGCTDTLVKTLSIIKKPVGNRTPGQVCRNGQVDFAADTLYNALSYVWDFGDSSSFTQKDVSHVYSKSGLFRPKLTVQFNGSSCSVEIDSILVTPLPDAGFSIPTDTFCFNYNRACIKLNNPNQKIVSRSVIFDDGFVYDSSPFTDSFICHQYTDSAGGVYSITVEMIDSNGCIASNTISNGIVIHSELAADFTFTAGDGCFKTAVDLLNTSNETPNFVSKFKWDFGDGALDSVNWSNFEHVYTNNGSFTISLELEDIRGCKDTFVSAQAVQNTNFVVDAAIDTVLGICHNNNITVFSQTPVTGATIEWNFRGGAISNSFTAAHAFNVPGVFYPWVLISKNGCDSIVALDSIVIHGPVATFGAIRNRFQCQAKDTVYFQNNSILFRNQSAVVRWDAGDFNASNCEIITKDNQNVGSNCRYSRDSLLFQHLYSKGVDTCYYAKLVVSDTIVGCKDSVFAAIPLMPPLAKGLFVASDTTPCPGPEPYKTVTFDLNLPKPQCIKYAWWVMWDSLKAEQSGNFDSLWQFNSAGKNYEYTDYAGDSNGYVTIGLIVENGRDTNGNICRDTGWFHHIIRVTKVSPNFTSSYNPTQYYCPGSSFAFYPIDSNQSSASNFVWDFGDGNVVNRTSQGYITHVFKRSGIYRVKLTVYDSSGCTVDSSILVNIGFSTDFGISSNFECVGDTFRLIENNRYYNNGTGSIAYWSDSSRTGKESISWDLGDGNGFQNLGANPVVQINEPGVYYISMAATDSTGCKDTLFNYLSVTISGVYAGFTTPADTILCAQTVKLNSTAGVTDSVSGKSLAGDFVSAWEYDFGSSYPKSFLANPARYFATGNYNIRQIVTNNRGCKDTFIKNMLITGPVARFNIISDTIGCAPLSITFDNQSNNATSYSWIFGDISNNSFGTNSDTNVTFTYGGYGNFYPKLIARGSFTQNGITRVCNDIFPDTSLGIQKTITVWEQPKPNFTWSTNCRTGTTTFTNTSVLNTGSVASVYWDFGDGNKSTTSSPTHTYSDTGTYRIVLYITSDRGCQDSIVRNVVISPQPIAWFGFSKNCVGTTSVFRDSSIAYNDRIYRWQWNFGDGTFSNTQNPNKLFGYDTTYNVSLTITNVAGCTETVSRNVLIYSRPKPSFTFVNVCDKNAVTFANNSTSKQNITEWTWKLGDGNTSTTWNDTHTYNSDGSYQAKLILNTEHNCMDSVTRTVTIYPNPVADINIPNANQCFKGNSVRFEDSSNIASGSTSTKWSFGNGDTSTAASLNYSYPVFGNYTVQLLSVSNFGCKDSTVANVNIYSTPKADFEINITEQCQRYNNVAFTDSGSIGAGSYSVEWLFGDGTTSTLNPVNHHYADSGDFTIMQILTSDMGCKDTATGNIRIHAMPTAIFGINDTGQCLVNNSFVFTNNSLTPPGYSLSYAWKFGNGDSSALANPVYSYNAFGTYNILLTAQSNLGCKDSATAVLTVYPMPQVDFEVSDFAQCLRQNSFTLTNTSTVAYGSISYDWQFGDGNTSNTTSPSHVFAAHGNYNIQLIGTTNFGCLDTVVKSIVVHPMPSVKIVVNDSGQCINDQQFVFTDSSSIALGSLSRQWKFGDSTFGSLQTMVKTYNFPGTKTVWLIETSDKGCGDSASVIAEVFHKPFPSIAVNDTMQCLRGNIFTFTNNSAINTGSMTYSWNFGDSAVSSLISPTHSYSIHRNYKVSLQAESNFGCIDSAFITVTVFPMPVSRFLENDSEQCLRQNRFVFTNNSSIPYGSLTYRWSFGDTGSSQSTNPVHVYSNYGTFTTRLIAVSSENCADTFVRAEVVDPMPQVSFTINDTAQCINNQLFTFNDQSTIAYGNLTGIWKFSDSTSSQHPISRMFFADTMHSIVLIQLSDKGCMDSAERLITVHSAPELQFSVNDTDQCVRQNRFVFSNNSSINKGTLSWNWAFGDGNSSDSAAPLHSYANYGTYKVVLRATSEKGCTDTLAMSLRADPMPFASFSINDTGQCINNQLFQFTNLSTLAEGRLSHLWKFGDTDSSTVLSPSKTYSYDTMFRVWLIEISDKNCVDSVSHMVDVYPKPNVNFSINDTLQCLRQNNFVFTNSSNIKYGSLFYNWSFGDGQIGNNTNESHVYSAFGQFDIVLRAVSDLGCRDTLENTVIVGAMPIPGFAINDAGQCIKNQDFRFTNQGGIGSGTFETIWKFGDGDTAQTTDAGHTYSDIGQFRTRQILVSNYGCIDSVDKLLWVYPNSNVSFTTNDSDQCENQQNFVFRNTSTIATGNIAQINWNLGNGSSSNQQVVTAYYPNSGFYNIVLTTVSDSGCIDSIQSAIRVYPKPAAWFNVNDSAQCLFQNDYLFTDVSFDSFGVNIYNWNINGENKQTTKTANYVFGSPGFKNITLISTSLRGCSDTITRQVYVKPMPDPGFEKLKSYYCELTGPYTFLPNTAGGTFYGKNIQNNIYNPVALWLDTVKYIVTVNGCTDSSSQVTQVYPGPRVNLGNDTTLCKYEILELTINSWQSQYIWDNGSTLPSRRIVRPGQYYVTVSNICGVKSDTVNVQYRDINCRFFLPTAFTPNSDGTNDRYKPVTFDVDEMTYMIYNRWGQKVYEGNISDSGWDGTYMGETVANGTFVVVVSYKYDLGYRQVRESAESTFELLR